MPATNISAPEKLGAVTLGFGYAHEWPETWKGEANIDSGPIIPVFDISAGSSGMAFIGASSFGDDKYLASLAATLDFAGFPVANGRAAEILREQPGRRCGPALRCDARPALGKSENRSQTMKIFSGKRPAIFQRAEFLSARDMLQRAAAISVIFLLAHLAGFREYTGILNGTIGSLALGWNLSAFLAVIYIVFYLAFVVLVPVLVLAAMLLTVWQRFRGKT